MPNSPFRAAARKLARSHYPLTPGDDMVVELTLGELSTFAEESMNQAAGRLDALHAAAAEAFDRTYHASDAALGIVRLLADEKSPLGAQATNLLELVCDRLAGVGRDLEMACRKAEAGHQGGDGSLNKILDGLRGSLIVGLNPNDPAEHSLVVNVKDGASLDHLRDHAIEIHDCFLDGIAAVASLVAEVQFYAPSEENGRNIRRALLLIAELTRALPVLDHLQDIAHNGLPVSAVGPKEGAADG